MSKQVSLSRKKNSGGLAELVRTVVYALLIALVVRTVAFEPFNIPSGSMIPSLLVGDYLFVSKYSYGYSRHSLPFSLPVIPGHILNSAPERGDVAVFKWPRDNRTDYIKRIVGLPRDRIQVIQGVLHINGTAVARRRVEDYLTRGPIGSLRRVPQYVETLPNGAQHRIIEGFGDTGPLDNTGEFTVPEGHYFAMGDNRDSSADSRGDGRTPWFVPAENLVGRAEFLFFSTDGSAALWEIWGWPGAIRWGRLFNGVG